MKTANHVIASVFYDLAFYHEMEGVAFKPQAYERAAEALEALGQDVQELYQREGIKGLEKIPGVGKSIAEKIEEYLKAGKIVLHEEYRKKFPVDLEELGSVEGVGPKKVKELYEKLGIRNIADLESAAKKGKIRELERFGKKTEENILQSIEFVKRSQGRWLLGDIYPYVYEILSLLKKSGIFETVEVAGSIRRMKETIGDIDILGTTETPEKAVEYFLSHIPQKKIWGKGATKVSIRTLHGFDIDLRVLSPTIYGAALQYFTGSKEHNVKLRTYAVEHGLKVSEYGVFRGKKLIAGKTEEEVYKALGMPYIEPELREDRGEIEAALENSLPKMIEYGSLRGDLQIQTNWTDGKNSIEEMAKEAKRQGLEYIAITDHTRDLAMTGGSDEPKLLRQMKEIDEVNKRVSGIRVLKGAEVNIRKDGTLDISDEVLSQLDVVGVSVHSLFKMSKKDMTERIVRAIKNPNVDILFDMDAVMDAANETGTMLEANAHPERLDLKDSHIKMAIEKGVQLVIDSDAHNASDISFLRYGVAQARRGWAAKKDILNTLPVERLLGSLKNRKI
ncbi:MAG: DNA polymerase/3'-5' exonuclease PolX [Candidatus Wildermuthbacteria bacterium]|nr:DNA polymerase/3'-5' exonuclease PolX [Candidatus Wildermuthbacteria bacterium]